LDDKEQPLDDKEQQSADSWSENDEDLVDDGDKNKDQSSNEENRSQSAGLSLSKEDIRLESGSSSSESNKSIEVNILEDLEFLKALDNSIADVVIPPEKKRKEKSSKIDNAKKKRKRNLSNTSFSGPDCLENVLKQLEALNQDEESPAVPDENSEKKPVKSKAEPIEVVSQLSSEQGSPKAEEHAKSKKKRKKTKDTKRPSSKKKRKKHKSKSTLIGSDNLEDVLKELERLEKEEGDTAESEDNEDSSDNQSWKKSPEKSADKAKEKSLAGSTVVSSNNTSPKQSSDWFDSKSLSKAPIEDDAFQAMFKLHYGKQKEKLHKQQKRARQNSSKRKNKLRIDSSMLKRENITKSPSSADYKKRSRVMITASQKEYIHRQRQYKRTRRKIEQKKHENEALTFKPAINNRKKGWKRDGFLKEVEKDMERRRTSKEKLLKQRQEEESELFRPRINKDDSVMQFGDVFNRLFLKGKAKQATKEQKKRKKPKFSKAARRRMRAMVEKMHNEAQRKRDRQRGLVMMRNARENAKVNAPKISAGSIRYIRNRLVRFINKGCMTVLNMPMDMEFEELELSYEQLIMLFRVLGFYERKDSEETDRLNPDELQINDRLLRLMDPSSLGKVTYTALVDILNQFVGSGNTPENAASLTNADDNYRPWRPAGRIVNSKRLSVPKVRIMRNGIQQSVDNTKVDASLRKAIQSLTTNQLSMNPISEITKDRVGAPDVYPEPEPKPKRVFINLKRFEKKWRRKTNAWEAQKNKWVKWKEANEVARAKDWPFKPTIISQNSEYYSYDENRKKTFGRLYKDAINRQSKKQIMMQQNETAKNRKLQDTCPFNPQLVSRLRPRRTPHLPAGFASAVKRMQSRKSLLEERFLKKPKGTMKRKFSRNNFTPDSSPISHIGLEGSMVQEPSKKPSLMRAQQCSITSQEDPKQIINVDLVDEIVKAVPYNSKEEDALNGHIEELAGHDSEREIAEITHIDERHTSSGDEKRIEIAGDETPRRTRTRVTFNDKMEYFLPTNGMGRDMTPQESPDTPDQRNLREECSPDVDPFAESWDEEVQESADNASSSSSKAEDVVSALLSIKKVELDTPNVNAKNVEQYFEDSPFKPKDLANYFQDAPSVNSSSAVKYLRDGREMSAERVVKYYGDTTDVQAKDGDQCFEVQELNSKKIVIPDMRPGNEADYVEDSHDLEEEQYESTLRDYQIKEYDRQDLNSN